MMASKSEYGRMRPAPLGLNREWAAEFVGVGATLFDEMVADGRMPPPRLINNRTVWDAEDVYDAFKALPHRNEASVKKTSSSWNRVS
jgi:hypothetical protein